MSLALAAAPHTARTPSPLSAARLAGLTRYYAEEVRSGRFPWIRFDADHRWHSRIYRDPTVDVWLISWLPTQGTELHDHGGSSGSFTVVSGVLDEAVWVPPTAARYGRLAERDHQAGRTVTFGPDHVHDVRNTGSAPAVSVHAYSAPLESMNYFSVTGGRLDLARTLDTNNPEPDSTEVVL